MRMSGWKHGLLALATLLAFSMMATGCETTQSVVDVRQHPTQDVTVIHTVEQGGMSGGGNRFWHCVREGDELVCDVVCGDDINCPQRPGLIRANRSAAAQLGGVPAVVTDSDVDEKPKSEEDADEAEADEEDADWSTERRDRPGTREDADQEQTEHRGRRDRPDTRDRSDEDETQEQDDRPDTRERRDRPQTRDIEDGEQN